MSFQDADKAPESRYLNFPSLANKGDSTETRILLIDETPVYVWQHRIGNRPINCPGDRAGCPACHERKAQLMRGVDKKELPYRMSKRWRANVLVIDRDEVKILDFSQDMLEKFQQWEKRLMEQTIEARKKDPEAKLKTLQNQVFVYVKAKTGTTRMDISYDLIPDEALFELSDAQKSMVDEKHDLAKEIEASSPEQIAEAIARGDGVGGQQTTMDTSATEEATPAAEGAPAANNPNAKATTTQLAELALAAKKKKLELSDIGVVDVSTLTGGEVDKLMALLKG